MTKNTNEKAKEIHSRVITLDSHVDINIANFTAEKNYLQKLTNQVNLPNMEEGGLDVVFLIVYTGQAELNEKGYKNAYKDALNKFKAIHKLTEEIAPESCALAVNSNEVKEIYASGKKVFMIGVENGYPLGLEIGRVKEFYDLGARYMSLSHNGHSQASDSNTGEEDGVWLHNGLSDFGKKVVVEMNKLGMMIDVSHPSKEAMRDMIHLSKAPIIASHSSARVLCNHPRNLDDEQLDWMKKNGGVVQAVAFGAYINIEKDEIFSTELYKTIAKLAKERNLKNTTVKEIRKLKGEERQNAIDVHLNLSKEAKTIMDATKYPQVSVSEFVDHIDYLVGYLGINHVGISSDFDGGGGIAGWDDASETLNVTIELVNRGYTEEQIGKLWSGNLLRVLDEVQAVAKKIQGLEV